MENTIEQLQRINDAIGEIQTENNRIKVELSNIYDELQNLKNDIYDLAHRK